MFGKHDAADLVAEGLQGYLLFLGEEKELGGENEVRIEGKIAKDGLGLIGESGLSLQSQGEGAILYFGQAIAMRKSTKKLVDIDFTRHRRLWYLKKVIPRKSVSDKIHLRVSGGLPAGPGGKASNMPSLPDDIIAKPL